ncbi:MAG: cytochrome c oxidase subunit II [Thermonemataceae bacterium]|nr:cytochrome c oxidase subunit II [Thermonemataceae bacterium]
MNGLIITLVTVLMLAIFLIVFRLSNLASILKNKGKNAEEIDTATNNTHAYLFLILPILATVFTFWYTAKHLGLWGQPHAVAHGKSFDSLFSVAHIIIILMFLITNAALFFFAFKYRYKKNHKATFFPDNSKLEIIWTIVPAIILTTLVFTGWRLWRDVTKDAPENAIQIEVMGKQFNWIARYPGNDNKFGGFNFRYTDDVNELGLDFTDSKVNDDFQATELHLVKGKPVHLKIRARDVIHSVGLPHFRQKMDAVPGQPTKMWFIPTKTTEEMREELKKNPEYMKPDPSTMKGDPKDMKARWETFDYELVCQEICGRGHFSMRMRIIVHDENDYKKWVASQKPFVENNKEYVVEAIKRQQKMKKGEKNVSMQESSQKIN